MNSTAAGFHTVLVPFQDTNDSFEFTVPTRYTKLQFIDAGGQGIVVSANDSATGTKVAIKKMTKPFANPKAAQRAFREFALLSSINHPNVIRVFSVFTPQTAVQDFNDVYLVMEFVEDSLSKIINKVRLDHQTLSFFIYQLLCAVNHLHRAGITHRDLKPDNIVVNVAYTSTQQAEVTLKVLDFGLARQVNQSAGAQMSAYVVTRYYRAPEVVLGLAYAEKVDVWSIGCIFAEMITHEVLFPGRDHKDQWNTIVRNMGTPSEKFIASLAPQIAAAVRKGPSGNPIPLEQLIPDAKIPADDPQNPHWTAVNARQLITKMIAVDPSERCSITEALQDPYVRCWYREDQVNAPSLPILYDRLFDGDGQPSLEVLKSAIFDEVKHIESSHNVFG
ncbi:hypothetical protein PENTCL1PPCAC_21321 [Pristionchus entomophagus]|uniref:Stress-activated protein kinase JNK n=1 Tax=Pristionchus entomophagus TaxID=358040 RepID=A0AAV5TY06_9BILA|nr:hypothetical protein PENTCL1PPCAC_21321 [Pristionchus entomophagus]